jgi:hypothetical protein
MLKKFYKTLLTSILCGSLLMLNFSLDGKFISVNGARAESVATEGIKGDDLMSTLAMTSIGLIASRLYTYKQTTDTMLAAAGGAAFIAGEILAFMKLKKVMKDMETQITRDKNGNIDQKQIEVLEKLKQSYVEAKGTANTKKTLQMAAAAAFAAAAIAALVLKSSETMAFQGCGVVLKAAGPACPTSAGAATGAQASLIALQTSREVPGPSMSTKATETTGLTTFTGSLTALTSSLGASATSYAAICARPHGSGVWACPLVGACNSAAASIQSCNSVAPTCQMTGAYGIIGTIAASHPLLPKQNFYTEVKPNIFSNLMKYFVSEAKANLLSPMGIASGLAVKYVLATYASVGATIDNFLFTPVKRAVAWGVLSAMTFTASSATSAQIDTIEGNIQKIDSILNQMYSYKDGVAQTKTPGIQNSTISKTLAQNQPLGMNDNELSEFNLKAQGTQLPCVTGENSAKCPSFSTQLKSLPDFSSLPDSIQGQVGTISKLGDGLNGASLISTGTLSEASVLAGQAKALSADLAKREKELQNKLKGLGEKTNLAKEKGELRGQIMKSIQKELDANKMTAGQMFASLGGGKSFESGNGLGKTGAVTTDSNSNALDGKDSKKDAGLGANVVAIPAATIPKIEDKNISDSLNVEQDQAAADAALSASNTEKTGETIEDYQLKNDITKETDSSIFDLISNRYQKSGYPRLFKRIK